MYYTMFQNLQIQVYYVYFTDKIRIQDLSEQVHELKHQHIPNHIKGTILQKKNLKSQTFHFQMKQEAHGALRRSHDYACNVIVTK